jgi:hypothetical protein
VGVVAVFGAGDVGAAVLRTLAGYRDVSSVWAFDLDEGRVQVACADAAATAVLRQNPARFHARQLDLRSPEAIAGALAASRPDVMIHAATLQAWWWTSRLPQELWWELESAARLGPWIPLNLVLIRNLMAARADAGSHAPVVNISFPDAVNAALDRVGLGPTCGAGNSELLASGLQSLVADRLDVGHLDVDVRMLGHHFHVAYFWTGLEGVERLADYPAWVQITVGGRDVATDIDVQDLFAEAGRSLPKGRAIAARTAESAVKNAIRLLRRDATRTHVAAPLGLIGGYDARLGPEVEIVWPPGMSPREAQDLNERAQVGDGIERIDPDGTIAFTARASATMRRVLGYDCAELGPDEWDARAEELLRRTAALG